MTFQPYKESTMKVKSITLIAVTLALLLQTSRVQADGPVNLGTFHAIGERGAGFITVERDRKVKHSNESSPVFIVFEDGSWLLDADGIPNTFDGYLVTWDETGCYSWGVCNLE
jgi:hypothetical protein